MLPRVWEPFIGHEGGRPDEPSRGTGIGIPSNDLRLRLITSVVGPVAYPGRDSRWASPRSRTTGGGGEDERNNDLSFEERRCLSSPPTRPSHVGQNVEKELGELASVGLGLQSLMMPAAPGGASVGVWTRVEIDHLLDGYFRMLRAEADGVAYSKAEENRRVQEATGRSKGSIEFKFCNVSAALDELGMAYVRGYLPRRHAQQELRQAVLGHPMRSSFIGSPTDPRSDPDRTARDHSSSMLSVSSQAVQRFRRTPKEVGRMGEESSYWRLLEVLWDHSTGGAEVAATPTSLVSQIKGPSAAGISEASDWMRRAIQSGDNPAMLFLVGGPGAGKSHATSEIVRGLTEIDAIDDGLARRCYRFQGPQRLVRVINDATIPDETEGRAQTLGLDVERAIQGREDFVVCVNRGVLVEEAVANGAGASESFGSRVMRWLTGSIRQDEQVGVDLVPTSERHFIRTARLYLGPGDDAVDLVAVYLDTCSLFERRPSIEITPGEDGWEVTGDSYAIEPLRRRRTVPLDAMPAGALAVALIAQLDDTLPHAGEEADPVRANIQSLVPPAVLSGLLTMLRCSELTAGQAFTYRELWGALSRAILGASPLLGTIGDLQTLLSQPVPADPAGCWSSLRARAGLRWTEALFNSEPEHAGKSTRDPVARLTFRADPARDALPGRLDETRWDSGWATPVTDAFTSPGHHSPLRQILEDVGEDHPFNEIVTVFDLALDRAYVDYASNASLADRHRAEASTWYGAYLIRLFAGSLGVTAFRPVMAMWADAWVFAPALPPDLEGCLLALVRPPLDPSHPIQSSYLPLLESKAAPLVGAIPEPRLAIKTDQLELQTERDATTGLRLKLFESGRAIASVELDFALVRESLACTAGRLGMTDLSDSVSPRLERFRAARLKSRNLRQAHRYAVVYQDRAFPISIQSGE